MDDTAGTAAAYWGRALAAWTIPEHIQAAAPESPFGYSVAQFARRAATSVAITTPSQKRALEALPQGGTVLDVGCGAGAASLPLAEKAGLLSGVDPSARMLGEFRRRAESLDVAVATVQGTWPESASRAPVADVVVCHHVVYNVSDLAKFVRYLSRYARERVVLELTATHPLSDLNDLWLHFHGLTRPTGPTADDVLAVVRELGITPGSEQWEAPAVSAVASSDEVVAWTRRRLCLADSRDSEIGTLLAARGTRRSRVVVTVWWAGEGQ